MSMEIKIRVMHNIGCILRELLLQIKRSITAKSGGRRLRREAPFPLSSRLVERGRKVAGEGRVGPSHCCRLSAAALGEEGREGARGGGGGAERRGER